MRALIQRVSSAAVQVAGEPIARIEGGLLILLGIGRQDGPEDARHLARKTAHLRLFADAQGRFHHSLLETEGSALVVSQFTLYADCRHGKRPSFSEAAPPDLARPLVQAFGEALLDLGVKEVAFGEFGATMQVSLVNQGPVTLLLDSASAG